MPALPTPVTSESNLPPSPRPVLSVLLFLHFFAISLTILRGDPSRFGKFSSLLEGMVMPFSPYLTTLLLDSPHDEIVVAEEDSFEDSDHRDTDHRIEATLRFSDGHHETVQLGKDVGLPERRQRFVRLAHNLLVTQNDQNRNKDVMPTIICKGLLDSTGAQKLDFRCRRYRTQTLADAKSSDPRFRDPTDEHFLKTSYSADAEIDSDGAFNINRHEESKSDVAPVKGANTALPPSVPPVTLPPRRP